MGPAELEPARLRRWKLRKEFRCDMQGLLNSSIISSHTKLVMEQAPESQPDALSAGRRIYLGCDQLPMTLLFARLTF